MTFSQRFAIALSFAGEQRQTLAPIADALAARIASSPSLTPNQSLLQKALASEPVWLALQETGFLQALEDKFAMTEVLTPETLFQRCACPGTPAYDVLCQLHIAHDATHPGTRLAALAEPQRSAILAMCLVASERCINEEAAAPAVDLDQGLAIPVGNAVHAYVIAAAWLQKPLRVEIRNGGLHAPGCLDVPPPPAEYGHLDRFGQVRAAVLAEQDAWRPAAPMPTARYVKSNLLPRLRDQGIELILAVRAGDRTHPLADPTIRRRAKQELGLVTIEYAPEAGPQTDLEGLMADLQQMIESLHPDFSLHPEPETPVKETSSTTTTGPYFDLKNAQVTIGAISTGDHAQAAGGDIVNQTLSLEQLQPLLDAFLAQARATPGLTSENLKSLENKTNELRQTVSEPTSAHTGKLVKALFEGMETVSKGLDTGAELLAKLEPVKGWLLAALPGLAALF